MHVSEAAAPAPALDTRPAARIRLDSRAATIAIVGLLTAAGLSIRLVVAHQSMFADELSTYWIVTRHDLGGVLSTVHSNAEITPPLYFVLAWLSSQVSHASELVRLPSLVAGTATIPLVYLLGRRTVGRAAGLVGCALTAFGPFMIYYSTEARGYGLMMALTVLSTLAMLKAVDGGSRLWWAVYALATAGAAYSHYTCVFVLAAQLLWLLWAHPEARRPAIVANLGAVALYLPWITGLINDFTSPTSKILSALSPFDATNVRLALEHWSIGFPYSNVAGLRQLPGTPALVLLAAGLALGLAGAAICARGRTGAHRLRPHPRLVLLLAVALVVPVGEALVSAVSTHLFAVRNLAPAWAPTALLGGALVTAAGPRLRYAAALLVVVAVGIGGVKLLSDRYARPDYRAAAAFVERNAAPGDVVIDRTAVLSPGPLSGLDSAWTPRRRVLRADAPQESDHPFNVYDPVVSPRQAVREALAAAPGRPVYVVSLFPREPRQATLQGLRDVTAGGDPFPPRYRLSRVRIFPGMLDVAVKVYAPR
jgi:4-amino-4-deoxy-L-arabinose transferase-like glycosyltransferase